MIAFAAVLISVLVNVAVFMVVPVPLAIADEKLSKLFLLVSANNNLVCCCCSSSSLNGILLLVICFDIAAAAAAAFDLAFCNDCATVVDDVDVDDVVVTGRCHCMSLLRHNTSARNPRMGRKIQIENCDEHICVGRYRKK